MQPYQGQTITNQQGQSYLIFYFVLTFILLSLVLFSPCKRFSYYAVSISPSFPWETLSLAKQNSPIRRMTPK